jgi:hypothetical protein
VNALDHVAIHPSTNRTKAIVMQNIPIYEAPAPAFAAEAVDTHFTLMGDGDVQWDSAMQNFPVVAPQRRRTVSRGHGHGKM